MTLVLTWKRCRGCSKLIRFVETEKGLSMPIDPRPSIDGTIRLTPPSVLGGRMLGRVLKGADLARARDAGWELHTSHFATCPEAKRFRRPRRTAQGGATSA